MPGLRRLHELMRRVPKDKHQFDFAPNGRQFDCLFDVSCRPYDLSLTSLGENPLHVTFDVSDRYMVDTHMDRADYLRLAEMLRVHGQSFQKLIPANFLAELNRHVLGILTLRRSRGEQDDDGIRLGHNSDGRSFSHWMYHNPEGARGPSAANREKTERLMGASALRHSLAKRASSVWVAG